MPSLHRASLSEVTLAMQTSRLPPTAHRILRTSMPAVVRSGLHLRPLPATGRQLHQQSSFTDKPRRQSTLDRLGATRRVKIVVLVCLGIWGTMEGIFYGTWIYRYFTNKKTEEAK